MTVTPADINAANAEFWSLEQPAGSRAPSPAQSSAAPGVVTTDHVLSWFKEATVTPHRSVRRGIPSAQQVQRIVQLVNELSQYKNAPRTPVEANRSEVELGYLRAVQGHVRTLLQDLPQLIKTLKLRDPHNGDQLTSRLDQELLPALNRAAEVLGDPPTQGRHSELWRIHAEVLLEPLHEAWQATGKAHLSKEPNGPLVKVLCRALTAIDGRHHEATKISSGLKRGSLRARVR